MGMIEAEYVQPSKPGLPPLLDVLLRVDHEPVRIVCNIAGANGLRHMSLATNQETAAFGRQRCARVRHDVIERGLRDSESYKASTAIAMPIPPPIHRDAMP